MFPVVDNSNREIDFREQRAKQTHLCGYLATAARVIAASLVRL